MFFETYARLLGDFPERCDQLFGEPLSSDGSLWLSIDGDDCPALLFSSRRDELRSDIELRSVSAWFSRECLIEAPAGQSTSGVYTVMRLNDNDPDIARILLRLLEEIFSPANAPYTNKEVAAQILEISTLLKHVANSETDILGLWGELYILSNGADSTHAVRCWCGHKMAKYDFVTRDFVLEVKTTLRNRRRHRFSLDQLRPNCDYSVYIASLAVVELNTGQTAAELMDYVHAKIADDELRISFLRQCILKGGQDIYRSTLRLGVFPSGKSLEIFDATHLPVPQIIAKDPIENVRFDLDLTELSPLPYEEVGLLISFQESPLPI